MIGYVTIQGQMLEKFKYMEDFIKNVGLSRSVIYFKIGIYKFLKVPVLNNSTLSSHYFKNCFKII